MGILDLFRKASQKLSWSRYKELGKYTAYFSSFGTNIYNSEIVRSCVRPLAEFTSKATVHCMGDADLERLLNEAPNRYMTGRDFLLKCRTIYEIKNTVFIYIGRNERGKVSELYPIPYASFMGVQYRNGIFVEFTFAGDAAQKLTLPWEDLAVIRKDYFLGDLGGEDNAVLLNTLEAINTTSQGLTNAVKSTANLRGILKSTKAMLAPQDLKRQRDEFVKDYMSLENAGGIASLDATQEFSPITMNPVTASYDQMKEFRENVYRFFGVNDAIITANMNAEQLEAFYELRIAPFLAMLSQALTRRCYSNRERALGRQVIYSESKMAFASLDKKIKLFATVVLYGGMTTNEWRRQCGMDDIEGGDIRIMRLDSGAVGANGSPNSNKETDEETEEEEE